MAYNHGREDRKWRIWKEAEEKVLREYGVDEAVIEQIRTDDKADFNSNRRFYSWVSHFGEYLEGITDREKQVEVRSVSNLLDEGILNRLISRILVGEVKKIDGEKF